MHHQLTSEKDRSRAPPRIQADPVNAKLRYQLIKTWPRPEPWMLRRAKLLASAGRKDESLAAWNALARHLKKLSNLDRSQPYLVEIEAETNAALGIKRPVPVVAPLAPAAKK